MMTNTSALEMEGETSAKRGRGVHAGLRPGVYFLMTKIVSVLNPHL